MWGGGEIADKETIHGGLRGVRLVVGSRLALAFFVHARLLSATCRGVLILQRDIQLSLIEIETRKHQVRCRSDTAEMRVISRSRYGSSSPG